MTAFLLLTNSVWLYRLTPNFLMLLVCSNQIYLENARGNPRVKICDPYPYPQRPLPSAGLRVLAGYGWGFTGVRGVLNTLWVHDKGTGFSQPPRQQYYYSMLSQPSTSSSSSPSTSGRTVMALMSLSFT